MEKDGILAAIRAVLEEWSEYWWQIRERELLVEPLTPRNLLDLDGWLGRFR